MYISYRVIKKNMVKTFEVVILSFAHKIFNAIYNSSLSPKKWQTLTMGIWFGFYALPGFPHS